ncbi:MAG: recombinase family protein [Thermoleophilaceae bacterium]
MTGRVALVYVRVSRLDDEERDRKVSPTMQCEKAIALPELAGAEIEKFEDLDISGKVTTNRPGYQAMLERLAGGDVRYVVAYDLSRITRSVRDQSDFFDRLVHHGALFLESSTGRTIDPRDEDEELGANVLGSVNMHYRKKTARRIRDALATKVAHGELVGPVPAGYVRRKEVLPSGKVARTWVEPDPERAPIIREVFEAYATGRWSFKSLARDLNLRGVPMPRPPHFRNNRAPARIWTADVLKDLVSNPRYAGRVPRRDGQTFGGTFPALVEVATWEACERIRHQGRRAHLATALRRPSRYVLSGLLRCGRCGQSMSGWTKAPDRERHAERAYYVCYTRRVAGASACAAPAVPRAQLEDDVRAVLDVIALPEGFAEAVDAAIAAHQGVRSRSTIAGATARLERLRDLYELGDLTRDEYLRRREAVQAELASAAAAEEPTFVAQRSALRALIGDWDEMDVDQRKRLLGTILEEVVVGQDGVAELLPREGWKPYVRAALKAARVLPERKTGLEPPIAPSARTLRVRDGGLDLLRGGERAA